MEIGKKFNKFTLKEYFYYIENNKKYTDFNTLGLYRSILENDKLSLKEKIEVKNFANTYFGKFFDFLQLKDTETYFDLSILGRTLTWADKSQLLKNISKNQERILKEKKLKHRNFGIYSKHSCGNEGCPYNGLMVKKGSFLSEGHLSFDSDKSNYGVSQKSKRLKKERTQMKQIIRDELEL